MKEFLPIATNDGRPYRLLRVAGLAAGIFALFFAGVKLLDPPPDRALAARQAAELQTLLRQQPQFAGVRVSSSTNGAIMVIAADELPAAAKAELQRVVAERAPRETSVTYLRPIEAIPGGTH
jgi:hypothetical protein